MRPGSLSAALEPRIALFSDVDGTLLDASSRLAITAGDVARIAAHVELILASSRTLVELGVIQRRLGVVAPLIAENGAVVSLPPRWRGSRSTHREILVLGQPAARLRPRVRKCAIQAAVAITDQRDLLPDRGRSLRRGYSVCIRNWSGPGAERFLDTLRRENLQATRSGNWITITEGADKGTGVHAVLANARRRGVPFAWTAAIGNAANDVPLFVASKGRFAIRNPRTGYNRELLALSDVIPLSSSGAGAWREVLPVILRGGAQ
jgi:mannosyl-3-phosphoglycerate phosphatase